jgi:type VI secretion system protein ImpH
MNSPTLSPKSQALLERVRDQPWDYSFYAFMRLLENAQPTHPRWGTANRPAQESIRLGQTPKLDFAPAELDQFSIRDGQAPKLSVRFFGLFGPHGPLPTFMTEHAQQRAQVADPTWSAFADVFHHRLLLLFYRAWAQAQPTVSLDRPESDRFADYIAALVGLADARLDAPEAQALPRSLLLYFSGHLMHRSRNPAGLENMAELYLGTPARLQEYVGGWLNIPPSQQSRLNQKPSREQALGQGLVLGRRVWDVQHRFRLHLGPMRWMQFIRLLPPQPALQQLGEMLKHYTQDALEWSLVLHLDAADVPTLQLSGRHQLGMTSWLAPAKRRLRPGIVTLSATPRPRRNAGRPASL